MSPLRLFLISFFVLVSLPVLAADRAAVSADRLAQITADELFSVSAAFVAGSENYSGGWAELSGVRDDVRDVAELLKDAGFTVETNINLTRQGYIDALDKFFRKYAGNRKARLLVYYAGHGHTLKTNEDKTGYIVLSNAKVPDRDLKGFLAGSIPMDYFSDRAKSLKAKQVLFVFDSCFSGTVFSTMRSVPALVLEMLQKPVRQFISSGTDEQMVPDESVFRRRFVTGLRGGADSDKNGIITGSELGTYLNRSVSAYSGGTQTPVFGKMPGYEGEFVFFTPKEKPVLAKKAVPSTEKGELLAIIKENPHSPAASEALKRLREIDKTLNNQPPVKVPERKDFVMTAKSAQYESFADDFYPYVIIAPVPVTAGGKSYKAAFRIRAKDAESYKRLSVRKFMLKSVLARRLGEANLQEADDMVEFRRAIRQIARDSSDWVCPDCSDRIPAIAGLKG
ncbi:peptidase C14 caspase catalytic subunit p20 [Denitrovibrio acetiphilus DSM 12809]|uniref:Peptidase C14 caspase catalytic subunit p20 n=1 Tax=Denitrovibrio acetiphilus (strain DSM 12809 / NBRC 114555 / N2460) TaxID=522772 RepID=D4H2N6_DENA2|nr:caspase family protein [Denitrovibrio acetiphilus]ADD67097.1 peptidase C14 caspase catalytic subunit p20 [Denitrovibrio acetiphilus DSM 12809]